ncbi:MAG: HEAT repeat domain-containing protein [Anaerolineales bacterium]|nr:HEAT repeat domain-containing protein [Anaerolineales bacterium]
MFNSIEEAVKVAKDESLTELEREKALRYLETSDDPEAIKTLITALGDDDHGVRFAAAEVLAAQGESSFKYLLESLAQPNNVMLRDGARVVIHQNSSVTVKAKSKELLNALDAPGADIRTMEEATKLLIEWK